MTWRAGFRACLILWIFAFAPAGAEPAAAPRLHTPQRYGIRPNTPLIYAIPATGERPIFFNCDDLPEGLELDRSSGILTGSLPRPGRYRITLEARNASGVDRRPMQIVAGDQLALTPPMGWNTWNQFGSNIDERLIREMADAMVSTGLRDAGYQYINLDDHWQSPARSPDGILRPDPQRFPSGLKALADYVHARGLKLGIYSDAAKWTCGDNPGSYDHELTDASTWAQWGIDYVKYDYCDAPDDVASAVGRYARMAAALRATDRSILFSACEWGRHRPWLWAPAIGAHQWRTTWDLRDTWDHGQFDNAHAGIIQVLDRQSDLARFAGPGRWNDPDMLVIGLRGQGASTSFEGASGCSVEEYRTHFGMWCLLAAPLIISADLRHLDEPTRNLLTHDEAIAIDQDPLGKPAARIWREGDAEVWARDLADGSKAVGLLNRNGTKNLRIAVTWPQLALSGPRRVRDIWARRDVGVHEARCEADVAPHGLALLRLDRPVQP